MIAQEHPQTRRDKSKTSRIFFAIVCSALIAIPAISTILSAQNPFLQGRLSPLQKDTAVPVDTVPANADVSRESPRASLERFFSLTRAGNYDSATIYLDIPGKLKSQGPELARQLKAVLDRKLWVNLDSVSASALGDSLDGLPRGVEQLGVIVNEKGVREPVRLVRWTRDYETRWRFSSATVSHVPGWYSLLQDRWILEHLPAPLLRSGPLEVLWWQWLSLPLMLAVAITLGYLGSQVLRAGIRRTLSRRNNPLVSVAVGRLGRPFTLACALIAVALMLPSLGLYPPAEHRFIRIIQSGFFIAIVWGIWRIIDVLRQIFDNSEWAQTNPSSRALLPLGARTVKVVIFAIAVVTVFSLLGYPVTTLVAGLGLGGLALALAAQKTVENLFGAFSLGVDQPFREGDFVKVENFLATVETIGLRSTRFRTLDRTLISIPNGRVAEMQLETYSARDRLRLRAVIGLMYGTTVAQTREIITEFERILRAQPLVWPDAVVVRLAELGTTSINIDIMVWFETTVYDEFRAIRQDVLLQFMEVVEKAGARFAVPTRAVRFIENNDGTD